MKPRYTHQTADRLADFFDGFNLPVPRIRVTREETEPAEEQTTDLITGSSSQEPPRLDNNKVEQPSKVSVEPRRSKRGHIPKKRLELDPDKKRYQYL
jgi:hypothetical protein